MNKKMLSEASNGAWVAVQQEELSAWCSESLIFMTQVMHCKSLVDSCNLILIKESVPQVQGAVQGTV